MADDGHDSKSGTMGDDMFGGATIHASQMTSERCCYITGLLHAAQFMKLTVEQKTDLLVAQGVAPEEVTMPCIGKKRGTPYVNEETRKRIRAVVRDMGSNTTDSGK